MLTVSDTRTKKTDKSGPLLVSMINAAGHAVAEHAVVEDNPKAIRKQVKRWIKDPEIDVVITTGGTGFTGRDVTPEAVKPLFEKDIEGFAVLFHMLSYQTVGTSTVLDVKVNAPTVGGPPTTLPPVTESAAARAPARSAVDAQSE